MKCLICEFCAPIIHGGQFTWLNVLYMFPHMTFEENANNNNTDVHLLYTIIYMQYASCMNIEQLWYY